MYLVKINMHLNVSIHILIIDYMGQYFIIGGTLFGVHYKYCILVYCQEKCWLFDVLALIMS
jgi:hypothetical protein